ncbi:MAG: putative exported protein [Caulobacteraceae bacterium]|jgi:hypothetical protein|nr:putative exported protein [Caulobacteraceae bacterium]
MTLRFKLALAALLLAPLPAAAHHGWAGQDNSKVTTLEGKIDAVRYRNPHAEIDLTQAGQKWTVTLAPIERMETRGITQASLKVGDTVRIAGHRNLDMAKYEVKANEITLGGKTTGLR